MEGRAREWWQSGSQFEWNPPGGAGPEGPLSIFHAEFGDPEAPLVVFLHGFPTSSIDWFEVVPMLSDRYRVGVVDFAGFGFSAKPPGGFYTLRRDAALAAHYIEEVLQAERCSVVAHDRGDSVALALMEHCATGETAFELSSLVLSNANIFLPLSNLTRFQRLVLDPSTAPGVLEVITPEMLAAGMGTTTFTPARSADDPEVAALSETFAFNDGVAVIHDTIQYLVERSENEVQWLDLLAASPVPTTMVWGLYDTVSPLRVAMHVWDDYVSSKPGRNELWLLPLANHYLQNDQPAEFAAVVDRSITGDSPGEPGPLSTDPGAPILVDRSRAFMPSARDALAGEPQPPA